MKFLSQDYWKPLDGHPELSYILQYLAVGFLGFCLNMVVLTSALLLGAKVKIALILGIAASTLFNFVLDRHWVFSYARHRSLILQFVGFIFVCLAGAWLNYRCAIGLLGLFPKLWPQVAEIVGIIVGTTFNYLLLRFAIFRG